MKVALFRRELQLRRLRWFRPEGLQEPRQYRKLSAEIVLVPRHQPHAATALNFQRPVA
jgi:hypothetical protein